MKVTRTGLAVGCPTLFASKNYLQHIHRRHKHVRLHLHTRSIYGFMKSVKTKQENQTDLYFLSGNKMKWTWKLKQLFSIVFMVQASFHTRGAFSPSSWASRTWKTGMKKTSEKAKTWIWGQGLPIKMNHRPDRIHYDIKHSKTGKGRLIGQAARSSLAHQDIQSRLTASCGQSLSRNHAS